MLYDLSICTCMLYTLPCVLNVPLFDLLVSQLLIEMEVIIRMYWGSYLKTCVRTFTE